MRTTLRGHGSNEVAQGDLRGPTTSRRPVVLNVNDTSSALYLTTRILERAGFDVVQAHDGTSAMAQVVEASPDLILLDIHLPDIDGHEVARRLRADPATGSVPVVLTSATFVTSARKARAFEAGADAYLTQPFEDVELVALVKSLLRLRSFEIEARNRADALLLADRRKNEFLAMLAHELRNPLSAVSAGIGLLLRDFPSDARATKIYASIDRQTRHLARLVDDLLDVSRITHGKVHLHRRNVELREVVDSAIEAARPLFERSEVTLSLRAEDQQLVVDGDPTRLEQVIANLLDNALKYTPKGGAVVIELSRRQDARDTALLKVRDTGAGIAAPHLDELFHLFVQGDTSLARSQGGLGIGLTMVRRLVEMHGGAVRVSSEGLGRGTEFTVELPLCPDIAVRVHEPHPASAAPASRRVLLVDDNVDSCELFQLALEDKGHTVEVAHDGAAGLAKVVSGTFDVAVIDIGLPEIDGYELARQARKALELRTPRLVAMTGYGRPADREAAYGAGFDTHLVKPVDLEMLASVIAAVRAS